MGPETNGRTAALGTLQGGSPASAWLNPAEGPRLGRHCLGTHSRARFSRGSRVVVVALRLQHLQASPQRACSSSWSCSKCEWLGFLCHGCRDAAVS